jgi:hypothetical protein
MESTLGLSTLHHIAFAMSATSPRTLTPQGLAPWPGIETFHFIDTELYASRPINWMPNVIGFPWQRSA